MVTKQSHRDWRPCGKCRALNNKVLNYHQTPHFTTLLGLHGTCLYPETYLIKAYYQILTAAKSIQSRFYHSV